jgi:membrane protein implicated in regulation of membrane protease activity
VQSFFQISFFTVLVLLTLLAGWTWYKRRGTTVDQAQERVFRRFVAGIVVFWLVAFAGFLFSR